MIFTAEPAIFLEGATASALPYEAPRFCYPERARMTEEHEPESRDPGLCKLCCMQPRYMTASPGAPINDDFFSSPPSTSAAPSHDG